MIDPGQSVRRSRNPILRDRRGDAVLQPRPLDQHPRSLLRHLQPFDVIPSLQLTSQGQGK